MNCVSKPDCGSFDKIFWVGLALPHFSCIHVSYFFWKSTHHGEILSFVLKYCRKREVNDWIPTHNTCITMFSTVFSTQNPRFLHDELIFHKNMVYIKNAEERAGLKIFCQKSWEWSPPCQNKRKPSKIMQIIYCMFPKGIDDVQIFADFARIWGFFFDFGFFPNIKKFSTDFDTLFLKVL